MSDLTDRLRAIGVSEDRIAALGIGRETVKPSPTALASLAARLLDPAVQSDLDTWRSYRDEADAFRRMRLRIENGDAIERGREIDRLPEVKE
jgi:hypothetical protein